MADRIAFAAQLDLDLLNAARRLADAEGREIEAVVEEALADMLQKCRNEARPHIMAHFEKSFETFGPLHELLAK